MNSKMSRSSYWYAAFARLLAVLLLVGNALFWLIPEMTEVVARQFSLVSTEAEITLSAVPMALGLLLSSLYLGLLAYALFKTAGLFSLFAKGIWVDQNIVSLLRRFGLALLAFALASPVVTALMTLIVTYQNPPGQRVLAVSLSSDDMVLALIAVLILMISHSLLEAVRIADENRQIV